MQHNTKRTLPLCDKVLFRLGNSWDDDGKIQIDHKACGNGKLKTIVKPEGLIYNRTIPICLFGMERNKRFEHNAVSTFYDEYQLNVHVWHVHVHDVLC